MSEDLTKIGWEDLELYAADNSTKPGLRAAARAEIRRRESVAAVVAEDSRRKFELELQQRTDGREEHRQVFDASLDFSNVTRAPGVGI